MSQVDQIKVGEYVEREESVIAAKLFKLRTKLNLERSDVAGLSGIDEKQLFRYENAIEAIAASDLFLLANILGVSMSYFYEEEMQICGSNIPAISDSKYPALLN